MRQTQYFLPVCQRLGGSAGLRTKLARFPGVGAVQLGTMNPNDHGRGIRVFLLYTLALSSVFYFFIVKSGHLGGGWGAYVGGLMWCPGIAAILTCKYLGRPVSSLGWKWGNTRYQVACYLIPLFYSALIYALVWLTGIGGFYNKGFVESVLEGFRSEVGKPSLPSGLLPDSVVLFGVDLRAGLADRNWRLLQQGVR